MDRGHKIKFSAERVPSLFLDGYLEKENGHETSVRGSLEKQQATVVSGYSQRTGNGRW